MRDVKITAVLNGWVAQVGCQTVVYTEKTHLLKDLDAYMDNPEAVEKAFSENAVNKRLMACPRPIPEGADMRTTEGPFTGGGMRDDTGERLRRG